jgi:hypothetical protein
MDLCPSDHVLLGLEYGRAQEESCQWKKTLCCADPKPPEIRDDAFGSEPFETFQKLLLDDLENPTCLNLELIPFPSNPGTGESTGTCGRGKTSQHNLGQLAVDETVRETTMPSSG